MSLRTSRVSTSALLVAFLVLFSGAQFASAADAPPTGPGNGIRISPVRTELTIKPGEKQTVQISVTNITAAAASFQSLVNDFTANKDESGNPAIILDANKFAPSHSLKRFVTPIPNLTLQAGQQKNVDVVISVPPNTPGGGYYGAIRFAPAAPGGDGKTVSLAGSVGSLILVKVPGNITEQLTIASFDTRSENTASTFFTKNKGIEATIRFQNQGNIQVAPFGKVVLKNRSGRVIAEYEVNNTTPKGNVLPDSARRYDIPLKNVGSFGKFKLEGNFGYGSNGQLLSASTTFYVVPTVVIILFICLVAFLIFLIFGLPRLIKAYNRSIIRKARR